jgi:uncharacterized protein
MFGVAFILGVSGGLHCLGMCSPLAMAATGRSLVLGLLYNGGRILSYGVMGVAVSGVGSLFQLVGLQEFISIAVGCLLIFLGISGMSWIKLPFVATGLPRFSLRFKNLFSDYIAQRSSGSRIVLGMVNGVLPCGLSMLALGYCITLSDPIDGFSFMVVFGIATLPVMLGLTSLLQKVIQRFNLNLRRTSALAMIILGSFMAARGLYHHPTAPANASEIPLCR